VRRLFSDDKGNNTKTAQKKQAPVAQKKLFP